MKILRYNCTSGISGDMNLSALIDLGANQDLLISELKKLNLDDWSLSSIKSQKHVFSRHHTRFLFPVPMFILMRMLIFYFIMIRTFLLECSFCI